MEWAALAHVFSEVLGVSVDYLRPPEIERVDAPLEMMPFSVQPATLDDIHWICATARRLYGRKTAIELNTKTMWYKRNPTGFWVLKDSCGRCRGSCEVFPLTNAAIEELRSGKLQESEIEADHIELPRQPATHRVMYLENLMAIDDDGRVLEDGATRLMLALPRILAAAGADLGHGRLYTVAARYCWRGWRKRRTGSESKLRRKAFTECGRTKDGVRAYYIDAAALLGGHHRWAEGFDPRA
jgi:hypothetical protein